MRVNGWDGNGSGRESAAGRRGSDRVIYVREATVVEREGSRREGRRILEVQVVAHTVSHQLQGPCDVCLLHAATARCPVYLRVRDTGDHPWIRSQVIDAVPHHGRRRLHVKGCESARATIHRDRLGQCLTRLNDGALRGRERSGWSKLELVELALVIMRSTDVVRHRRDDEREQDDPMAHLSPARMMGRQICQPNLYQRRQTHCCARGKPRTGLASTRAGARRGLAKLRALARLQMRRR
eukprot:scaffold13440_cov134-Isochrysis_galbana.AAC.3